MHSGDTKLIKERKKRYNKQELLKSVSPLSSCPKLLELTRNDRMITNNQEILDKLRGINCLIEATANLTTGDDIPHIRNALYFLSEEEVSNEN